MRFRNRLAAAAPPLMLLLALAAVAQIRKDYRGVEEPIPHAVAPQPIAFSHKQHIDAAKLKCTDCHTGAATEDQAGIPATAKCMACHRAIKADRPEIRKLAALHAGNEKVPWVRIYRVRDFVFFSHTNHVKAGAECENCHGPVALRDVLAKEVSTNMASCVDCHRARKVSVECTLCHQLGQ